MRSRAVRDMIRVAADWKPVENGADDIKTGRATMSLILIIVILVLLLGGGGFGYSRYGYRGGIGIGGILLITDGYLLSERRGVLARWKLFTRRIMTTVGISDLGQLSGVAPRTRIGRHCHYG